jgi:hypothetical protein
MCEKIRLNPTLFTSVVAMASQVEQIEEIKRKSEKVEKVVILKYVCIDCRKERKRVEEETYRKIDNLPGPKTKQLLQFFYIERKNLDEGGEGVEKHLLNEYMVPDKSLNAILTGAFEKLKVGPDGDLHAELRFNHLNDYVMDCDRRGKQKQCAKFLKMLDLYEAQNCVRRSKVLHHNVQQYVDIAYSKIKCPDPHPFECKCEECKECSRILNEMELAEIENNPCLRPCCYKTDQNRVEDRFNAIQDEREERLALRRTNDARKVREVSERNQSCFRLKPPPKVKKRAV